MPDGTSPKRGIGEKIGFSLFFLLLLGGGLFLSAVLINALYRGFAVFTWPKTSCHILWSGVEENPEGPADEAYRFKVVYRYEVNGRPFSGDRYSPKYRGSSQSVAEDLVSQFPAGSRAPCYYDRGDPSSVMLYRPNPLFYLPLLLVALVFTFLGGTGLYRTWEREKL